MKLIFLDFGDVGGDGVQNSVRKRVSNGVVREKLQSGRVVHNPVVDSCICVIYNRRDDPEAI